jgi:predicted nucleotidyltransferase
MNNYGMTFGQIEIIRQTIAPFAGSIEKAGLFGSRATGNSKPNSDIDLVLYGLSDQKILDRIHTLFTESKLPVTVDVQAYDLIKYPPLKKHIDEVVKILFTKEDLTQKTL